jgi:hypothetical protein
MLHESQINGQITETSKLTLGGAAPGGFGLETNDGVPGDVPGVRSNPAPAKVLGTE